MGISEQPQDPFADLVPQQPQDPFEDLVPKPLPADLKLEVNAWEMPGFDQGPFGGYRPGSPGYEQHVEEAAQIALPAMVAKGVEEAGKGAVFLADLPTRVSNWSKGATPESPNYTTLLNEHPRPQIPRVEGDSTAAGAANVGIDLANSMVPLLAPPEVGLTLPLMGAGGSWAKIAGSLFGASMGQAVPQEVVYALEVLNDPKATDAQKTEAVGNPVVHGLLAASMLKHGASEANAGRDVARLLDEAPMRGAGEIPAREAGLRVAGERNGAVPEGMVQQAGPFEDLIPEKTNGALNETVSKPGEQTVAATAEGAGATTALPADESVVPGGAVAKPGAEASPAPANEGIELYHGTRRQFDKLAVDDQSIGLHFGTQEQAQKASTGRHYGDVEPGSGEARVITGKVTLKNPWVYKGDVNNWGYIEDLREAIRNAREEGSFPLTDEQWQRGVQEFGTPYPDVPSRKYVSNPGQVRRILQSYGVDGVVYDNQYEGKGQSHIVFDPERSVVTGSNAGNALAKQPVLPKEASPPSPALEQSQEQHPPLYRGEGNNLGWSGVPGVQWWSESAEVASGFGEVKHGKFKPGTKVLRLRNPPDVEPYQNDVGWRELQRIAKKHGIPFNMRNAREAIGEDLFGGNVHATSDMSEGAPTIDGARLMEALKKEGYQAIHTDMLDGEGTMVLDPSVVERQAEGGANPSPAPAKPAPAAEPAKPSNVSAPEASGASSNQGATLSKQAREEHNETDTQKSNSNLQKHVDAGAVASSSEPTGLGGNSEQSPMAGGQNAVAGTSVLEKLAQVEAKLADAERRKRTNTEAYRKLIQQHVKLSGEAAKQEFAPVSKPPKGDYVGQAAAEAQRTVEAWGTHHQTVVEPLKQRVRELNAEVQQMHWDAQRTLPKTKSRERMTKKAFMEKYGVASLEEANELYKRKNAEWQAKETELAAAEAKLKELAEAKDRAGKAWSRAVTKSKEQAAADLQVETAKGNGQTGGHGTASQDGIVGTGVRAGEVADLRGAAGADLKGGEAVAQAKAPWEMTFGEWGDIRRGGDVEAQDALESGITSTGLPPGKRTHEHVVRWAAKQGKPVPAEVLAEYPDLARAQEAKPSFVGMGAAVPAEFEVSPQTATGIKNATVDAERVKRGLPEAMQVARRSFGEVWDRAMAMVDHDPGMQDALLTELRKKPRALTDVEDALLLHRQIDLQNEYGKATRELAQAFEDGRMEAVEAEKLRVARVSDELLDLYNIGKRVGTETGRGLAARKMMAYEDFSLAAMEMEERLANGGRPLTDAERAWVQKSHEKVQETRKAYEEYVKNAEEKVSRLEAEAVLQRIALEEARQPKIHPKILEAANKIVAGLDRRADAARIRLRERLARTSAGVDPTILADLAEIGASHLAHGVLDAAKWGAKMAADVGEWVKPHLDAVRQASEALLEKDLKAAPEMVRTTIKKGATAAERKEALNTAIKGKVSKGKKGEITWHVQQLARMFVQEGIKDREALIDAVHGVLKEAMPELTRREAMDAISGYGDFKQLSKEQIAVELRGLKGEMQQIAKLEDIQARKPPLKSGVERRTVTDEERRLVIKVNEAKRKYGVVVTDPATQLKSALESRKTYYRNQIADLEKQIADRERFVPEKTAAPTDAELQALKAKREALKKDFDAIFGKPGMGAEQYARMLERDKANLEESIAAKEQALKDEKFPEAAPKVNRPAHPELEVLRQRRDALNRQIAEARKKPAMVKYAEGLAKRLEGMNKAIAEKEARIAARDVAPQPRQANRPLPPELEQAKQKLEALNREIAELRNPKRTEEEIALQALKTRLQKRIEEMQDRMRRGDFSAKPRRSVTLDPEAVRLKAEHERVKKSFQRAVAVDRYNSRSKVERGSDLVTQWRRGFILSGVVTLAKLTSAAIQRMAFTPMEEVIGYGISKVFPGVAMRAPREGGLNVKAEAKAITQALTQGMKDAWHVLRTGESNLDVLYGKESLTTPSAIDFFGHVHGALKAPVKRAEFARSMEKRTEHYIANGVDVSDPLVQSRLVIESYQDALRSIFMQDNRVVTAYKRGLQALEAKNKVTGEVPLLGKAAATTARVLLPIVKIPTNIVAETMQYAVGSVTGSLRLARAYKRGIETLHPEEADMIMRSLKKGSVGAATLLLGFFAADSIGGYYQRGQKHKKDDPKHGTIRLFGLDVPKYLLHNPLLETLQIGATIRRVADSKLRKKDKDTQGIPTGVLAAALGLVEEVPFAREPMELAKLFDPNERGQFFGELAKSLFVPTLIQQTAQYFDTNAKGEEIKRKPETVAQHLKSGIPGLRQSVPKDKKQAHGQMAGAWRLPGQ